MRGLVIFGALFAIGCGGGGEDVPSGSAMCADMHGLYRVKYTKQSGDCGDIPDAVINSDDMMPTGCVGTDSVSPDNCVSTTDATCPRPDIGPGVSMTVRGKMTVSRDAKSASGTVYYSIQDSTGQLCSGIYNAVFTAL